MFHRESMKDKTEDFSCEDGRERDGRDGRF